MKKPCRPDWLKLRPNPFKPSEFIRSAVHCSYLDRLSGQRLYRILCGAHLEVLRKRHRVVLTGITLPETFCQFCISEAGGQLDGVDKK